MEIAESMYSTIIKMIKNPNVCDIKIICTDVNGKEI